MNLNDLYILVYCMRYINRTDEDNIKHNFRAQFMKLQAINIIVICKYCKMPLRYDLRSDLTSCNIT